MPKSGTQKGFKSDKNGVKRIIDNDKPIPGGVEQRNADARFFPPAGKVWSVDVMIDDVKIVIASGITSTTSDKVFCLQVVTRVHDNSNEPVEIPTSEIP